MIEIFIDGASAGNPGPSAIGIFIKNGAQSQQISRFIGQYSNHEAEFIALVEALKICIEEKFEIVHFRTDSQIVSDSLEKKFVKNELYKPYLQEALKLSESFSLFFIKWVPSKANQVADNLARAELVKNKK